MTPIEQAKAMLPNVPREVFDTYLGEMIIDLGWSSDIASNLKIFTQGFFKLGALSLYEIGQLRWHVSSLFLNKDILCPYSYSDIQLLIRDHVNGNETFMRWSIAESKPRFLWHMAYIKGTGHLFAPVVLVRTQSGLRILDGNHRIAALFSLEQQDKIPVDAWIGSS